MVLKSEDNEIKYLCEIEAEPIYLEAHSSRRLTNMFLLTPLEF